MFITFIIRLFFLVFHQRAIEELDWIIRSTAHQECQLCISEFIGRNKSISISIEDVKHVLCSTNISIGNVLTFFAGNIKCRSTGKAISFFYFYRPQHELWKGNVFTGVCMSTGGVVYTPGQTPPRQTPLRLTHLAPTPPPRDDHCSGQYGSYWNAFLLNLFFELINRCFV